MAAFAAKLSALVTADPGLPNPNPTTSYWQLPVHETVGTIQSPVLPTDTDIVVIGSGITGCSVTKALLEDTASFPGVRVTVLEARSLVSGATGRNGGHCVSAAGHKFATWAQEYGIDAARAMARFSLLNVQRVQAVANGLPATVRQRSEVRAVEKLVAVTDPDLWRHCQESIALFNRELPDLAGHNRLIDGPELAADWGVINAVGGYAQPAAALWPYRLCTELFALLLATHPDRLAIETHTPVTGVVDSGETAPGRRRYTVVTPRGNIQAGRVVYCTNGYSGHLLPRLRGKIYPFRGHMSTQAVPPSFPSWGASRSWSLLQPPVLHADSGLYHHGLYYLQQNAATKDMFVGVENQHVDECLCADDSFVSAASLQDLPTLLPRMFQPAQQAAAAGSAPRLKALWSGVMGMTSDGLPLVGRLPASATGRAADGEEWIAAGFQGYGMDKCWLTGEALVAMIAGMDVQLWFPSVYVATEERIAAQMSVQETTDVYVQMAEATRTPTGKGRWAHI